MAGPARLFDSHCHLQDPGFDEDRDAVLERAWRAGVRDVVVVASDPGTAAAARALTEGERGSGRPRLHWTAGLHPHEAARWDRGVRGAVLAQLDRGALAVGETGLDFHYDHSPRIAQREAFKEQLAIAVARDLPVVVHSRDAEEETLDEIARSTIAPQRVVLHCFTGSPSMLELAVAAGHYISFSGMVTFRSFPAATLVGRVPEDRLLVETDAPYLAPAPHRGKRNEPAFLADTVARLAELREVDATALAALTRGNAMRFYGLPGEGDPGA